jgi:hypothetical protein
MNLQIYTLLTDVKMWDDDGQVRARGLGKTRENRGRSPRLLVSRRVPFPSGVCPSRGFP